ncbi:fluoride efflux transporter CrcB [Micromonospora sp. NBC_01699]|uniref:fluoride efflux transporter CrcB n=1 Tax=Micromonospora sp. NBC_01699 TaxID=2975984 RepID=UPI002E2BF65A|nr:fluoride efflux transporter CrcB [Micromonospora sp. NBC_01699]
MTNLLLVLAGGAIGAACRFLVDRIATRRLDRTLPWGTLTVNVAGSLVLGLLAGLGSALPGWVGVLVGTGFCGALTTYSTFSYETVRLAGETTYGRLRALLYVAATLIAGLGAAALGWWLGQTL